MIRRFEHSDLHRILYIEGHAFPKSAYSAEMFLYYHGLLPDGFFVLEEEVVLGYILFEPDGHVLSLAVDPALRRQGIGRSLMIFCEDRIQEDRLWVEVRASNLNALRFYEKLGFQPMGRIPLYYGTEDAHVLEKKPLVLKEKT